jgi:hypothetical protein
MEEVKQTVILKGEVGETPIHGIRCETQDFETVAKFLKTAKRSWSYLMNVLAREIRQNHWINIDSVLKKVLIEEKKEERIFDV